MFFNNALVYRLTQDVPFDIDTLEHALAAKPARACAAQEISTYGFVAPLGRGPESPLVVAAGGFLLIAARKEERILPGSVVKDALKEKIDAIEAEQLRKVYKKERDQLKEDIVQAFLPRAFIRKSGTFALIMPEQGLIVVDSSAPKRAEDLLSTLRECMGSLPIRPITSKIAPSATLTDWIKTQKAAEDFFILDEALLRDTHEDGGSIKAKRQDLTSDEMQMHLDAGKQATQLALGWQDKLSFMLDDKLVIKRLRFEELLQDQAEQDGGDDEIGQSMASLLIMGGLFAEFIPALLEAMGGEEIPQGIDGPGYESRLEARAPSKHERRPEEQVHLIDAIDATVSEDEDDPLYAKAVQAVRKANRPTVSYVQRALTIGYNRAARMIERMETEGVITAPNSNGVRDVMRAAS